MLDRLKYGIMKLNGNIFSNKDGLNISPDEFEDNLPNLLDDIHNASQKMITDFFKNASFPLANKNAVSLIRFLRDKNLTYLERVSVKAFNSYGIGNMPKRELAIFYQTQKEYIKAAGIWIGLANSKDPLAARNLVYCRKNIKKYKPELLYSYNQMLKEKLSDPKIIENTSPPLINTPRKEGIQKQNTIKNQHPTDADLIKIREVYLNGDIPTALEKLGTFIKSHGGQNHAPFMGALVSDILVEALEYTKQNKYERSFEILNAYLKIYPIPSTGADKLICSYIFKQYINYQHAGEQPSELVSPLLDNKLFSKFMKSYKKKTDSIYELDIYKNHITSCHISAEERSKAKKIYKNRKTSSSPYICVIADNFNFIVKEMGHLEDHGNYHVRTLPYSVFTAKTDKNLVYFMHSFFIENYKKKNMQPQSTNIATRIINDSDVIFIEWCNAAALYITHYLWNTPKRIVLRVHSYEAFSHWPYFTNWGAIDEIIFVAPHIQNIFLKLHPIVKTLGIKTTVIPTYHNMNSYKISKRPNKVRPKTLMMLGWATENKDPLFALKILKKLRGIDPDWKIVFVGNSWRDIPSETEYIEEFNAYIKANNLEASIEYVNFTTKIKQVLNGAGYILSTSHREGTHEAIIEGIGHGCVPVIRNWPMVSRYGGSKKGFSLFEDNIFKTVNQAVEIIINTPWNINTAEKFRGRGIEAFHYKHTMPNFKEAINGTKT